MNGRDPSSLVNLSAGVTNELFSQASTLPGNNSFPTSLAHRLEEGGKVARWYLLDGISNMDTFALLAAPFPNADATQEFRVISNNFDARYGFAPSAVVSILTKSGTNKFHGGVFEFIRSNDLNAANWFSGNVDQLKRNQFGGYAFYNHVWDAAPFAPSYNLNGTGTTPLSFDNPWNGFASTGGVSPFPPFASPSQLPASDVSFTTFLPASLGAVFAKNYKLGLTESWNLSVDQQFGKNFALHLGYVDSSSYHIATIVEQNPGLWPDYRHW